MLALFIILRRTKENLDIEQKIFLKKESSKHTLMFLPVCNNVFLPMINFQMQA